MFFDVSNLYFLKPDAGAGNAVGRRQVFIESRIRIRSFEYV